jgi:hypothetical protein
MTPIARETTINHLQEGNAGGNNLPGLETYAYITIVSIYIIT